MKKIILSVLSVIAFASIVFISCGKKTDDNAIAPGYAIDGAGTGGNPNTTNVTTTGNVATTSVANQNSTMTGIGQGGVWTSINCSTPAPLCVSSNNGSATISICFTSAPVAGTYQLVSTAAANGPGKALMTVTNPTSQPTGTTWYSSTGTVTVVTAGTSITVSFSNIACFQSGSVFPSVTLSGQVGCL